MLPGEPTDGTGRVCIHLFVRDETAKFQEEFTFLPVYENGEQVKGRVAIGPSRGRLACDPSRSFAPELRGGAVVVTMRSDDPRAVSCPKCIATAEYKEAMFKLAGV